MHGICELVGPTALVPALEALAPAGRVCLTGYLEGDWETERAEAQPRRRGVPLRRFTSSTIDRHSYGAVFQETVRAVADGRYRLRVDRTFPMSAIAETHRYMEDDRAADKVVVLPPGD